ncbi:MAG TPA: hypothetical protein VH437_19580 [Terriglobales bacterium]|jgi:hypothetical protein
MIENGSEPLPLESPEEENKRLREENARLRRILVVRGIPIPQFPSEERPSPRSA